MAEQKKLDQYQERVVEEKAALDDKIKRLMDFINSEIYVSLKPFDRELLEKQFYIMLEYSKTLRFRIINFQVGGF
jgi:hypothetical protein